MTKAALTLEGMSCQHCVRSVMEALKEVKGVTVHEVQVGRALVEFEQPGNLESLRARLAEEGYPVVSVHDA